ncbi:MAG TPA: hypothetical protein VFQ61_30675, partial [Polyangiaceae bacterium]|nr:hypothetical protein [Polyangiaceae bacterium]
LLSPTIRRFDILVLNFERINLFLENFHKLRNFDPERDRIVISDCSNNAGRERERVARFANERGWILGGPQITLSRRPNWGLAEGARIDYFTQLLRDDTVAPYVWQFQEHYLDTTSDYSRWPASDRARAGQVKADILPDGMVIDLDICEQAFSNPDVAVLCAPRCGLGIFSHPDGREWLYADGANFGFRTSVARRVLSNQLLDDYRLTFDASYRWAIFMEFEYSRLFSEGAWFDLVHEMAFRDVAEVRAAEQQLGKPISTIAEESSARRHQRYERRARLVNKFPELLRQGLLATHFKALGIAQTKLIGPSRAKLLAMNIDSPQWFRDVW